MKIAVTAGDVAGIGPEVALKALEARSDVGVILVGPENLLRPLFDRKGVSLDGITFHDTGSLDASLLFCGKNHPDAGRASRAAVVEAVTLALRGEVDAVVTAPISKKAWQLAGYDDPGHTELIGRMAGGAPVMGFSGEMSTGETIRLALVTIHEPLAAVPGLVTADRILETLRIAHADLRARFGISHPRIGVAGLNPHAGEMGRIGFEDDAVIAPALESARRAGISVEGPIPGDTLFLPRTRARFDLLVAMYHDQGLAPFKALTCGAGVNVTLGLSIIRTSPDHGTAFEIAGRDQADASSMRAALRLAITLARSRAMKDEG
jgi:4-hydroxythreonine-4-phosphate dehydrogenase